MFSNFIVYLILYKTNLLATMTTYLCIHTKKAVVNCFTGVEIPLQLKMAETLKSARISPGFSVQNFESQRPDFGQKSPGFARLCHENQIAGMLGLVWKCKCYMCCECLYNVCISLIQSRNLVWKNMFEKVGHADCHFSRSLERKCLLEAIWVKLYGRKHPNMYFI